jgi:hypothetical protein
MIADYDSGGSHFNDQNYGEWINIMLSKTHVDDRENRVGRIY